jgi:uncharacterized protein (AIM24 family)
MAKFEVLDQEGMHSVRITLDNETVQTESGALCLMTGDILMDVKLPGLGRAASAYLAEEAQIRPTYTGTGTVLLEPSFGGFHIFELGGATWVLDSGTYWASDGSVALSAVRERAWTSFWAGEGFIDWQTKVTGHGTVVLASPGPVEEVPLESGKRFVANGKYVVARTLGVTYAIRRPARSLLKTYMSREGYCRTYDGPGRLLVCSVPYWRYRLFGEKPELARGTAGIM